MKTLKTLLAVAVFIGMFFYVQSEEKKLKNATIYKTTYANKMSTDSAKVFMPISNLSKEAIKKQYASW